MLHEGERIELLIGADLLYCVEIVDPLMRTVAQMLARGGRFILCSSFDVGEAIEEVMRHCTALYKLHSKEIVPLTESSMRIQFFEHL